jgi:N6-L-threonylcarbamoyladenine synthase
MKKVLGIETSCDDTCMAVVCEDKTILFNEALNQNSIHRLYNGVVPELAARMHSNSLSILFEQLQKTCDIKELSAVAATSGPGLIGGLITGSVFAKTLSSVLNLPFIAVNHLEAHLLTIKLVQEVPYPYLSLLVSGGHCQFVAVMGLSKHVLIGSTLDDSLGETFDKAASMMGLNYPGGPEIETRARQGNENTYKFPMPMFSTKCPNLSFSGLKTYVKNFIDGLKTIDEKIICDICASFQKTVLMLLTKKIDKAIKKFEDIKQANNLNTKTNYFVLSGGVASNTYLRNNLKTVVNNKYGYEFLVPPINLCTDNGAMIAYTGLEYLKHNYFHNVNFKPRSKWPVENLNLYNLLD